MHVLSGVRALHLHRRRLELTIDAILAVPGDSQAVDLLPSTAALCLAWRAGAASFCSRSGSGLELVVGGFACRDAFGFVLVCLDTLAISLVDCVDRFYVAARRSTGYGYTNSRSCSAAAIPASLAALECRFSSACHLAIRCSQLHTRLRRACSAASICRSAVQHSYAARQTGLRTASCHLHIRCSVVDKTQASRSACRASRSCAQPRQSAAPTDSRR